MTFNLARFIIYYTVTVMSIRRFIKIMGTEKMLFTAGQFAKLHNINKRTLHYYDDIGLFSPIYKGENGYRYYTYQQSPSLEMLLTLREIGMSIEEINSYLKNRSPEAFKEIVQDKTTEIDKKIKRLGEIKKFFKEKESQLELCEGQNLDKIDIVELPQEYLLLSESITGELDDKDFAVLIEHMQSLDEHRIFKSYGSMMSVEKILSSNYEDYDCFYTRLKKPSGKEKFFKKPKGKYIRAFCKGDFEQLPDIYKRIRMYAEENGLTLKGYSYEEGVNEIAISSIDEYITQITILCE